MNRLHPPIRPTRRPRAGPLLLTVAALSLLLSRPALAHVFVDHADPKVGSTLGQSPTEVKVWFTGEVEPAFSGIEVYDGTGRRVDKKDCHADAKDKSLLIVSVSDLPAGSYEVRWHAVSTDTHKTKGDFKFTVRP